MQWNNKKSEEIIKIQQCSKDDFINLRLKYISNKTSYIDFMPPFDEYRFIELLGAGGNIIYININGEEGYFAGYKKDNTYIIKETSFSKELIEKAMPFIYNEYSVDRIQIRGLNNEDQHAKPFGMYKWLSNEITEDKLDGKHPYMNMMLD